MNSPKAPPARHRWFDQWQGASGPALRRLVEETVALLAQYEAAAGTRQRKRREADHRSHLIAVEAVVSNLAYAALMPPATGRLAVLLRHGDRGASRYDNPALGKPFAGLLGHLDGLDALSLRAPSAQWREASSIAPTPAFAAKVRACGISLDDFGRLSGEEPIILKRKPRLVGSTSGATAGLVDYFDTDSTVAMRGTVQGLNTFLDGADVSFVEDGRGAVDHRQRHMRRHFVLLPQDEAPRFDRAGRLFGGFWQNLERGRRGRIRIEGESVVDLDFASMFPRLAYAEARATPPDGDLYHIEGLGAEYRPALKLAVNTLLFDDFRRTAWPVPQDDRDPRLPPDWTVARTKAALLKRHPALLGSFGVGLGYRLMHTESVILVRVLDEMRARGIVGLGLHDGFLLPRSRTDEGKAVMEHVARETTGHSIPVAMKGTLAAA